MRQRLKENFQQAKTDLAKLKKDVGETGQTKVNIVRLHALEREVDAYSPNKMESQARAIRQRNFRGKIDSELEPAELGDKVAPFTKYGKNYNDSQLYEMYNRVGKLALGLPSFGPNILRTVHVTAVMTLCYCLDINLSDQRIQDHFALARHGMYEMKRSYNLVKQEKAPVHPDSLSAKVAGVINAHGALDDCRDVRKRRDFLAVQRDALRECLGTDFFDGLSQGVADALNPVQEALIEIHRDIREGHEKIEGKLDVVMRELGVGKLDELLRLIREQRNDKIGASESCTCKCKSAKSVDESQEVGQKHGLTDGEKGGSGSTAKRKKGEFGAHAFPILRKMNGLVIKTVEKMGLIPGQKYTPKKEKWTMYNTKSFTGLTTEKVKDVFEKMYPNDDKGEDADTWRAFRDKEFSFKNARDCVRQSENEGVNTEWQDWFCRKCKKADCACEPKAFTAMDS